MKNPQPEKRKLDTTLDDSIKIILLGEPKSTSHVYMMTCRGKFASMYMSKKGKGLKEDYQWQTKSQYKGKPIEGKIGMVVSLYFGTKRRADIDNFNKLLYDALTGIVWLDDSQIHQVLTLKYYDKENPRIEVEVKELEDNK